MILALVQSAIDYEDKLHNLEKAEQFVRYASNYNADLVLFPEMSFTGFSMRKDFTGETDTFTLDHMLQLANLNHIAIGFGWVSLSTERKNTKAENHYTIISHDNKVLLDYVKCHPFSYAGENDYFFAGQSIEFASFKNFMISTAICYDLRFPELFQIISKKADFIVVPANWPKARSEHWITLLRARAIENQCYIAGINCTGKMNGLVYSGQSMVFDPNGDCLLDLGEKETVQFIQIHNDVEQYREIFPVKLDRREAFYYNLSSMGKK